jgi:hypothetical protein
LDHVLLTGSSPPASDLQNRNRCCNRPNGAHGLDWIALAAGSALTVGVLIGAMFRRTNGSLEGVE